MPLFQWTNDTDEDDLSDAEIRDAALMYYAQFMHPQLLRLEAARVVDSIVSTMSILKKTGLPKTAKCCSGYPFFANDSFVDSPKSNSLSGSGKPEGFFSFAKFS